MKAMKPIFRTKQYRAPDPEEIQHVSVRLER